MVTVSEKYTSLWKTEIEQAYKKLQNLAADDKEAYAEEQAQWEKDGSRLVAEVMLNKTQTEFEKASAA